MDNETLDAVIAVVAERRLKTRWASEASLLARVIADIEKLRGTGDV